MSKKKHLIREYNNICLEKKSSLICYSNIEKALKNVELN